MVHLMSNALRSRLLYEPRELRFGTSGRRGEVVHLSQLEVYINILGELRYLASLPVSEGGVVAGDEFFLAHDLRVSSTRFDAGHGGRGELLQTIAKAVEDAGLRPVNLGPLPTPALMHYAVSRGKASAMITGSHIPFDRNGYKLNTSRGELLKQHEQPVNESVRLVREQIYAEDFDRSQFDENGFLKEGPRELPPLEPAGIQAYIERYTSFFSGMPLRGLRVLMYQHSAVGRDLVPEILRSLGAEVVCAGRSETFIPIDTENIDAACLAAIQQITDSATTAHGAFDAVVSTDGDSDRPLVLGPDSAGRLRFFSGDLLGMIVAGFLEADAVVVPITCNDAIDAGTLAPVLEPKTRVGSPYVISGMEKAIRKGRQRVCGWEANGGFLTGSDIHEDGAVLRALPTRDAVLPVICVLAAAKNSGKSLVDLFSSLPPRFNRAALIRNFPREQGLAIIRMLSPSNHEELEDVDATNTGQPEIVNILERLHEFFPPQRGFGSIIRLNYTDGVRVWFSTGEVVHLRPSGNADEMRFYAVASTQERADALAAYAVERPHGVIFSMQAAARNL